MRNAVKSDESERAIKSAILSLIDESAVDHVAVTSDDDDLSEPSFFVTVYLKENRNRPTAERSIDMIKAMRDALKDVGDARFPHLSFSAPDDAPSEDTRRAE